MRTKKDKELYFGYENFLTKFCIFFYQIFIRNLPKNFLNKSKLESEYKKEKYIKAIKKSGMNILSEEYYMSLVFLGLFIFMILFIIIVLMFFISFSIELFGFNINNIMISSFLFFLSFGIITIYFISIFSYPVFLQKKREKEIDAALLKIIPYLKITSKDLSMASIIEIMPKFVKFREISIEFKKIQYYYDFLGQDINTSIRKAVETCPSKTLKDLLNDLVNITNSGGNIYSYLNEKEKEYEDLFMALERKYFNSLLLYSQIYITLLLISPLFYAIIVSLFNIVEFSSFSQLQKVNLDFSFVNYFEIIVLYFVLIFLYGFFAYLIYLSKPLINRLKSIEK